MKFISRSEEMFLLSIWKLKDNAYGVTIRETLKELTGETWAFGAIFITLDRLVKKGMLDSYLSDPTPERGGRSKRIYNLTDHGLEALEEIRKLQDNMWEGISELKPEEIN
ncbi:PadR family transcriptional regulator [candidate division KSB1 bacterium]